MKTKKALKRLNRVETLLSNVIDHYAGSEGDVGELLDDAKASVVHAQKTVNVKASPKAAKEPSAKTGKSKTRVTTKTRKIASTLGKRQSALANRKGIGSVAKPPLSKTA